MYFIIISVKHKMEQFFGISELLDYGLYLRALVVTLFAIFIFRGLIYLGFMVAILV